MGVVWFVGTLITVLVVSAPIHELGHVVCLWCLGNWAPKKIVWFSFPENPYVEYKRGCYFPKLKRFEAYCEILVALSGGLFAGFVLALAWAAITLWFGMSVNPHPFTPHNSLLIVGVANVAYGTHEMLECARVELRSN